MEPPPRPVQTTSTPQAPAPAAEPTFPRLEILDPNAPRTFARPSKRINDGADVEHFHQSKAYRDIGTFLFQLNRALCPRIVPPGDQTAAGGRPGAGNTRSFPLNAKTAYPESVRKLQSLLGSLESLIKQAPPDPGPRRFGNISFRKWHALVEESVDGFLSDSLPEAVLRFGLGEGDSRPESEAGPLDELKAYLIGGFGSAQRLDYGTGHELSFLAFLGSLWKLGAFEDGEDPAEPGQAERFIVLGVIEPYLKVIRRLILEYTLEPAGSHGVWGLDDHSFLPYIFGSAQFTRAISENEPMPLEGSVLRAPKPSDVTKGPSVEVYRETNMYFSAIGFIYDVKKGPFWEHSPMLFDISGIKDGWGKINKGMIKMYNAEVLSKFPVVQHFLFGSLFSWDKDQ